MPKGVEIRDLGIAKLRADLDKLRGQKVTIGVQGASGQERHPNADATVGQVAAWMEYGTPGSDDKRSDVPRGHIPARPFVRTTFDRHQREITESVRKGVSDLIDGRAELEEIQERVGTDMVAKLRDTIDDAKRWAEPLAESTIERKGHDRPLVESRFMRRKCSWAVRDGDTIVRQGGEE